MTLPPEIVMALEVPVGKSRENADTVQTQLSGRKHQQKNPPLLWSEQGWECAGPSVN